MSCGTDEKGICPARPLINGKCKGHVSKPELIEEVERLRGVNYKSDKWHADKYAELRKEGADARAEVERLKEFLGFYADEESWKGICDNPPSALAYAWNNILAQRALDGDHYADVRRELEEERGCKRGKTKT